MIESYCQNCNATVGFKRNLGWGTFFGSIITFGLLFFLVPFYPKRCIKCGAEYNKINPNKVNHNKNIPVQDRQSNIIKSSRSFLENLIYCPHCGEITKVDAGECSYCHMFLPTKKAKSEIKEFIKKCPFCAEEIKREAIKCKHCGSDLPAISPTVEIETNLEEHKDLQIQNVVEEPKIVQKPNDVESSVSKKEQGNPEKNDHTNNHNSAIKKNDYFWLGFFGVVFFPFVFAWFTLRKGYSWKAKVISFGWMIVYIFIIPKDFIFNRNIQNNTVILPFANQELQKMDLKKATAPENIIDEKLALKNSYYGNFTNARIIKKRGKINLKRWNIYVKYMESLPGPGGGTEGIDGIEIEYDEIWVKQNDDGFPENMKIRLAGQFDINRLYWRNNKVQASTLEKYYLSNPITGQTLNPPTHKIVVVYGREQIIEGVK